MPVRDKFYFYVIKTPPYKIIAGDSQTHISNLGLGRRLQETSTCYSGAIKSMQHDDFTVLYSESLNNAVK